MDVDTSIEEMEVDAWEMESVIEFCTSMKGFVKSVTWGENVVDVVGTVARPDMGKPWRPTAKFYAEQLRVRRLHFSPGSRNQRKNDLFVKGCECKGEDACRWCLHFDVRYSAKGLAEAAAQHRNSA